MMYRTLQSNTCTDLSHPGKNPDVPSFPYEEVRKKFQFLSLLTSTEVIDAMVKIREECGHVNDMSLFLTGSGKPLKLEEFDQAQGQASMQVSTVHVLIVHVHMYSTCTKYFNPAIRLVTMYM